MTDKKFKRLNRAQLIEIIYQLQVKMDELSEENQRLITELADKRLRISRAGSIAEAALEMNDCLRNVQQAADQYLEGIEALQTQTASQCEKILADARAEAAALIAVAQKQQENCDFAVKTFSSENGQNRSDQG